MGDHEYEERMVTSAEARQMLLGEQVGLMRARLEDQRMHSVEFGNLLCTTFNAMVAVQQEHNVIVREGMATHARLLRTAVATEKKKAATFEKLLYRTGAIYFSMITAGTMPPPVHRSASTDTALDVVDSGVADAPIVDSVAEPVAEPKA